MTHKDLEQVVFPFVDEYLAFPRERRIALLVLHIHEIKIFLLKNSNETSWRVRLALLYFLVPIQDFYWITEVLGSILSYDPQNVSILLLYAVMEMYFYGQVCRSTISRLNGICSQSSDVQYMVAMANAFHYQHDDPKMYRYYLHQALILDDTSVEAYASLMRTHDQQSAWYLAYAYKAWSLSTYCSEKINREYDSPKFINVQYVFDDWYYGYIIDSAKRIEMLRNVYGVLRLRSSEKITRRVNDLLYVKRKRFIDYTFARSGTKKILFSKSLSLR